MTTGRNDTCPCGSGKKYKRCCLRRAPANPVMTSDRIAPPSSNAAANPILEELERYLTALRASVEHPTPPSRAEDLEFRDRTYTRLDWEVYQHLMIEIRESFDIMLLPIAMPDVIHEAVASDDIRSYASSLFARIRTSPAFEEFDIANLDVYETELATALRQDIYSFSLPPDRPFPFLIRQAGSGLHYAPQYVFDIPVFSLDLNYVVRIPLRVHSSPTLRSFGANRSFIHEAIHVLQRVLRKNRVPAYVYRDKGKKKIRNPEVFVHVGVEDELEVQKIMVTAGYPFSLDPILYHKKSLTDAFGDVRYDRARKTVRAGLERIPFEKYEDLYEGDLREKILGEFCGAS